MAKKPNIIIEPQIEKQPFTNVEEDIVLNTPRRVTQEEIIKKTQKNYLGIQLKIHPL